MTVRKMVFVGGRRTIPMGTVIRNGPMRCIAPHAAKIAAQKKETKEGKEEEGEEAKLL